jgi:type VI secretion system protein VasJ
MGKHPAAKDYIRLGGPSSLMDAVAAWSAKGYEELSSIQGQGQLIYSWRFWLRGVKKGLLICGLGRDSSDSIGRPYPILIMGEGRIKGWEKKWPQLPALLLSGWKKMENIASRRYANLRALEEAVGQLDTPGMRFENQSEKPGEDRDGVCDSEFAACKKSIDANGYGLIRLNLCQSRDTGDSVSYCHGRLKECCSRIPLGVFMGGTPQKSYVVVIQRPLSTSDFVRLWTL